MRKELKNLRQYLESSVRAHRKHMASLHSTLKDVLDNKQMTKKSQSSFSSSSPSFLAQSAEGMELSLERGHICTTPIGFITSCFDQKNGTPRQPAVCSSSRARLKIQSNVFNNPEHALTGLHQYSHVWLIFLFHKNGHMNYKAKVKPPRLNGEKVGVYSTRSPHRPNAIGLTLAKLDAVTGDVLHLSGVDLISGTPVLDIKPYIPEYDSPVTHTTLHVQPQCQQEANPDTTDTLEEAEPIEPESLESSCTSSSHPEADERQGEVVEFSAGSNAVGGVLEEVREFLQQGTLCSQSRVEDKLTDAPARDEEEVCVSNSSVASWIRHPPVDTLNVRFTPTAERELAGFLPPHRSDLEWPKFQFLSGPEEAASAIRGVLAADPRSVYRRKRCSDRLFFFTLDTAHVTCWFGDGFAEVLRVQPVIKTDTQAQGGEVEISDKSDFLDEPILVTLDSSPDTGNNTTLTHEDTEGEHEDHLYCRSTTNRTEKDHNAPEGQSLSHSTNSTDITFKSFICPGGEVEIIGDDSLVGGESTDDKDVDLENPSEGFEDEVSDEHTESPSHHFDHLYCNSQTSELRLGKMAVEEEEDGSVTHASISVSENTTDVTFKSFTCPGGEVEITEESLSQSSSPMRNESLVDNDLEVQDLKGDTRDEHTELPSRHFDHLYCNTQTSELRCGEIAGDGDEDEHGGYVIHPSDSAPKNTPDVTFKSFTCPGGEVEISEESLLQCESIVQNESLVSKDSEVQETSDEHAELPSRHFDHPYFNKEKESLPEQVDDPVVCTTSNPESDISTKDAHGALNNSTAESPEKQHVMFQVSDAEVETGNMYRMFDMSVLMKGLNIYDQDNSESGDHGGESLVISVKDDNVYCHVMKSDPDESVSENGAHISVQISSSGVLESSESVERNEESNDIKSEVMVPEGSSNTTEALDVQPAPQRGLDQHTFANLEENVLKDENMHSDVEVFSDKHGEISHSESGPDRISENFSTAETQNVENHSIISHDGDVSAHADPEILRSESVNVEAQMKMWSHIILSEPSTPKHSALGHLWLSESPIPPPKLHSTILAAPPTPKPAPISDLALNRDKVMKDFSAVGKGPLQEQLRKMGELLIAASGKISAPAVVTPVQQHNACVWTTPKLQQERSTNTSAIMEEQKERDVSDACTSTDSLLWSVSRSNLESLSRSELEQKMISTLIMVEVLSQQLTLAQNVRSRSEPSPSSLRDRLVQTDRTELSQTGPYKELYVSALERIRTLEIDQETLHNLHQAMQLMSSTLLQVRSETEKALDTTKELEAIVTDDQEIQSQQLVQMKVLHARCMDMLNKMEQKNRVCVKARDDMKKQMEEALEQKSTVLRVLEQLRVHHTTQVSELQCNLGSHEELTAALSCTYPQLVELNRMHMDSVTEANTLLRETLEDHTHLSAELHKAEQLLQRTYPVLHQLQHKASAAVQQSHTHQEERDRAVEEREQMEQQLYETHSSLQDAHQQIADLNTQITIMSSEMAVLREQLTKVEDERSQLQRKTTELSATVSSSLASYAFLEQTLASETSKLQRSLHDIQEATERADSAQAALCVCERKVEELEQTLAQKENLISQLSTETENQRLQLRRLTQVQSELCNAKEMSEFLQAENELTREQLTESEGLLRSHLQGLRERNLECEDLRVELQQLRVEKEYVQQELVSTREKARLMLLDQGEQLAQAVLDTSLLLQRVCALTDNAATPDNHKSRNGPVQPDPSALPQSCSSFLNSVINALTEEQPCVTAPPMQPESCVEEEDPIETLGSGSSAFTRIMPAQLQNTNDKHSTTLSELSSALGESVSELQSAIEHLKQHKDSEIHTLHKSIRDLQEAMETQRSRHTVEEAELKQEVCRLKSQVEKDAQVLHQKRQDEKALSKMCSELEEKMDAAQKQRADNSELRREVADLRRVLQQSQAEVQALRAELRSTDQSAASMKDLDERIRLLREVEKLKASLTEVEESRSKLLERAKRHQMVHTMNQSKLERELHLLDDMIETVRKVVPKSTLSPVSQEQECEVNMGAELGRWKLDENPAHWYRKHDWPSGGSTTHVPDKLARMCVGVIPDLSQVLKKLVLRFSSGFLEIWIVWSVWALLRVSEKVGGAEGTKLDHDFTDMEKKVDVTSRAILDIITKTTEYLQPNPATRAKMSMMSSMSKIRGGDKGPGYTQTETVLGDAMQKFGRELGDESNFGLALIDIGEAMRELGEVKDALDMEVKQNFIDPMQVLHDKDLKEIQHHLKKLEGRRLDFDYKKKRQGKVTEDEIKQAVEKFHDSKDIAEQSMFNLLESDVEQVSQLAALVQAQVNYHRQAAEILQQLSSKIDDRIRDTSSKPRKEYTPKPRDALDLSLNESHNGGLGHSRAAPRSP
ncbi:sperm-associated antigen 5-like, partial [Clarias magur]